MAILGYTLLGILGAVLLLLCIPVHLIASYQTGKEPQAVIRWLFLRFDLTQAAEKSEQEPKAKAEKPAAPKEKKPKAAKSPAEFSGLLEIILDLLSAAKGGLGFLVRHFRLYRIRLRLVVAEEDAAETAISYGRVNAAVYSAYALAQSFLNMARPDLEIRPDFVGEAGSVDFEVRGRLRPIAALAAALRIGASFLVKTIQRRKQKQTPPPKDAKENSAG